MSTSEQTEQAAAPKASFRHRLALWGFKLFQGILRITPMPLLCRMGRGLGYAVWYFMPGRRRIVARNLRIVIDPSLRGPELDKLVRENIVRTCMNFIGAAKTAVLTAKELNRYVRLIHPEIFEQSVVSGGTGIACIPHSGNWEILARIRPLFRHTERFGSMYRRMSNPLLEQLVYKSRTAYGCQMFSKESGLRSTLKFAREGSLIGVLSDQFTQEGSFLPYFGKITGTTYLPALLYKRCQGTLYAIYTRNTSIGHWDAVMDTVIDVPENAGIQEITLRINEVLAECQKNSILDGFWMHDRWKTLLAFAPPQIDDVRELLQNYPLKPFRILVSMPEAFEEAILVLPLLRGLLDSRPDAQVNVICPTEQAAYWQSQPEAAHTFTTDNPATPLAQQLDADDIYNEGVFDLAFLLDNSPRTLKELRHIRPITLSGFENHPCSEKHRFRGKVPVKRGGKPVHRVEDYMEFLEHHEITRRKAEYFAPSPSEPLAPDAPSLFIAPFSTLGPASEWPDDAWAELIGQLSTTPTLLALPRDGDRATQLAERLGVPIVLAAPHEYGAHLNNACTLIACDGLIPGLAAQKGARCIVLMGTRLPDRYRPLGTQHAYINRHVLCHPCYRTHCDQPTPCMHQITVRQVLDKL